MNIIPVAMMILIFASYGHAADTKNKECLFNASQIEFFSSNKPNIVDYYRALQYCDVIDSDYTLFSDKGPLSTNDIQWITSNGQDVYPTIVDIKNGFIQVDNESGDGTTSSIQIVLLRNAKGEATVGYYHELRVPLLLGHEKADLSFYRLDKSCGKLVEVTHAVLPQITLTDFGTNEIEYQRLNFIKNAEFHHGIENAVLFYYELPRFGTRLIVNRTLTKSRLHTLMKSLPTDSTESEILKHYYNQIETDTIKLKWDKTRSLFVID